MNKKLMFFAVLMFIVSFSFAQKIIYVDSAATGNNNGTNWANAYTNLQTALTNAGQFDTIWVSKGTYQPSLNKSFNVILEKAMYGGFSGTETLLSQRNWNKNQTILSGNGNSVVYASGEAVIDGFLITGGTAEGGGIYLDHGKQTVNNCIITNNSTLVPGYSAGSDGGGAYLSYSNPTITNCVFTNNIAPGGSSGTGGGGAIAAYGYDTGQVHAIITNCVFANNSADGGIGGAIYSFGVKFIIANSTFSNDTAKQGGAIAITSLSYSLINCVFNNNVATTKGGDLIHNSVVPTITNCTFSNSTAVTGGGAIYNLASNAIISNCIFWGNTTQTGIADIDTLASSPVITYSFLQHPFPGAGNITGATSPFINISNPAGNDGKLGTNDDGLELSLNGPCIDAGENDSIPSGIVVDITGSARINDSIVDMGAYESSIISYIFNGNGNWSDPAQWLNHIKPPDSLPGGYKIIIAPALGGACKLDIPQTILIGGKLIISSASQFIIPGDLKLQ
jgi:hypothetical protein